MDSLTQITLGAAVGEIVAGKKIGNRAMLWGAIAGTIPDLDVIIGNLFMNDLDALAFHRGFMHSLLFAILFSVFMTFLVKRIYNTGYYQQNFHKIISVIGAMFMMIFMAIIINFIPIIISGKVNIIILLLGLSLIAFFGWRLWKNYYKKQKLERVEISAKRWYLFFFLTIVTHPILDCFTTYGTQLFQPFSNYRVAWDNISVFDPFYTAPFLILLLSAAFIRKENKLRTILNIGGLVISSLYMVWTFSNKSKVDQVFEKSLSEQGIKYKKNITTPTIANNFLWNCVAETDSFFYTGFYSILDKEPLVKNMIKIPINRHLIIGNENDKAVKTLLWFSNGFNSYISLNDSTIQVNDLRYGRFSDNSEANDSYIFKFTLVKNKNQEFEMTESMGGPPENQQGWVKQHIARIKGI